jgi:thiamine-monophosphate kinase
VKVAHLGEAQLIAECARDRLRRDDVIVDIGDDCAAVRIDGTNRLQLLKVDAVVEGVHFRRDASMRQVGWKAVCRAVSDIAAMGGEPAHLLVTIALARTMTLSAVASLGAGIRHACAKFKIALVGGETSRSPGPLFVNVALTGSVERDRCVTRDGGRAGDLLYVTGRLGGSINGKHLTFTPRLREARWLVARFKPHAMIDLSDGLASDLPRLAGASGCAFTLDRDAVPRTRGCSIGAALRDGEDYELLFAIAPEVAKKLESAWRRRFPKVPLTRIGALVSKRSVRGTTIKTRGYDHFA